MIRSSSITLASLELFGTRGTTSRYPVLSADVALPQLCSLPKTVLGKCSLFLRLPIHETKMDYSTPPASAGRTSPDTAATAVRPAIDPSRASGPLPRRPLPRDGIEFVFCLRRPGQAPASEAATRAAGLPLCPAAHDLRVPRFLRFLHHVKFLELSMDL